MNQPLPSTVPFRSLSRRLLGPLVVSALLAAVLVAVVSTWLGTRWATDEMESRLAGIRTTLSDSTFPLNSVVLRSIAQLTQTELIAVGESGQILERTVELPGIVLPVTGPQLSVGDRRFRSFSFATLKNTSRPDRVAQVMVLFDEKLLDASRRRAAMLPLATGLSTILALTTITLLLTTRLVRRIGQLQRRVESVAGGDFQSAIAEPASDEVGKLAVAVDVMAQQLDQLWKRVQRQQSEKLLHQVASGMAHQLRNSFTGARMAIELHAAQCARADDEGIQVALKQIELSEDYVRRLLLVASGQQDQDRPTDLMDCCRDLQTSLSPIAKHLRIELVWHVDEAIVGRIVQDGPTWVAAVSNLIQNALQAGDEVRVDVTSHSDHCVRAAVSDNGPGIPDVIAKELFEPFVSSKPEGIGLGLPLVRRAAESLGGDVRWRREHGRTIFELDVKA